VDLLVSTLGGMDCILGIEFITQNNVLIERHNRLVKIPSKSGIMQVKACRNPSFGLATKAKGLQGCGPRGRKPRSQGKGIAMVQAKRKPGSHITYSRECKKV
jgi:hypothetical protein